MPTETGNETGNTTEVPLHPRNSEIMVAMGKLAGRVNVLQSKYPDDPAVQKLDDEIGYMFNVIFQEYRVETTPGALLAGLLVSME